MSHPVDKAPIGERLSRLVAGKIHNLKILPEGPVKKGIKIDNSAIIVSFDHAEVLKTKDGESPREERARVSPRVPR